MIKKSLKTILLGTLIGAVGLGVGVVGTYKTMEQSTSNVIFEMKERLIDEGDYLLHEKCIKQKAKKAGARLIRYDEIRKM